MTIDKSKKFHLILMFESHKLIKQLYRRRRSNKAVKINIHKRSHDNLTVESVHESTMSGNSISKVFDLKGALKSAGKESTEWPDC